LLGLPAADRRHGVLSVGKQDAEVILIQSIIQFVSVYSLFHQLLKEGKKLLRLTGRGSVAGERPGQVHVTCEETQGGLAEVSPSTSKTISCNRHILTCCSNPQAISILREVRLGSS